MRVMWEKLSRIAAAVGRRRSRQSGSICGFVRPSRGVAGVVGTMLVAAVAAFMAAGGSSDPARATSPSDASITTASAVTPSGSQAHDETPAALGDEVVDLRETNSRTFRRPDGRMTTRVSPVPVNYRAADGSWRRIDNRLVRSPRPGYLARNAGNAYTADLPQTLDDPVRFAAGGQWVSFELVGGSGPGSRGGIEATYPVAREVQASLEMTNAALRETLTLASADAPSEYRYTVAASAGLNARGADGGVQFVDGDGEVKFGFTPPIMTDAAGATGEVAMDVARDGDGWAVSVKADADWLRDSDRVFPVTIDPDTYWVYNALRFHGANQDCYLVESSPTTSFCGRTYLQAGGGTSTDERWALFRFDVQSAIPRDSQVVQTDFGLYMQSRTGSTTPRPLDLHQVKRAWTSQATWTKADATSSWTASDINAQPAGPSTLMQDPGYWYHWAPTELVRGWVDGSIANNGLLLRDTTTTPAATYQFESTAGDQSRWPFLDVVWQPAAGRLSHYTYVDIGDAAGHQVQVNPGNGNVNLHATDTALSSLTEGVGRAFNTRGTDFAWNNLGPSWLDHPNTGISVRDWDGSAVWGSPDGAMIGFIKNADGTYRSSDPAYSLAKNGDGSYSVTVQDPFTGLTTVYVEWEDYWHASSITRDGKTLQIGQSAADDSRMVTDSDGKTYNIRRDSQRRISTITASDGRTWTHTYRSDGMLSSVAYPGGITITYTYTAYRDPIASVVRTGGDRIDLTYDTQKRVTKITEVVGGVTKITSFAYAAPTSPCLATDASKTTVTFPDASQRVYCFDANLRLLDHTPPPAPTGIVIDRDPESGNGEVTWDSTNDDPSDLFWQMRFRRPGGTWSSWITDADNFTIPSVIVGEQYEVAVQSLDAAGNVSPVTQATVTVQQDTPWTSTELSALDAELAGGADLDIPYDPNSYDAQSDNGVATVSGTVGGTTTATVTSCTGLPRIRDGRGGLAQAAQCQPDPRKDPRRNPVGKTKRKEKDLRCDGKYKERLGRRRSDRHCRDINWTWVYRLVRFGSRNLDRGEKLDTYYVGITNDIVRRCNEHKVAIGFFCQPMMFVPYRGTGLAIEQFLIEVYGFDPTADGKRPLNTNYSTVDNRVFTSAWFSGLRPTLKNARRNFSAKLAPGLYCAAIRMGYYAIMLYPPNWLRFDDVDRTHGFDTRFPPQTTWWWPNFPGRDCLSNGPYSSVAAMEDEFFSLEGKRPANPRT